MAITNVKVEINTGYGWADVSGYTVLTAGVQARRGRASQWDTSSTGTMTLTFDCSDGTMTPGAGIVSKNAEIRLSLNTTQAWTGFIDSAEVTIDSGFRQFVKVTCSDKFKHYAKAVLGSYGVEMSYENLSSGGTGAVYPMSAPKIGVGSFWTAHRDTSASPIRIYGGNGGQHVFIEDGPPFAPGSIQLQTDSSQQAPVLEHPTSFNPATTKAVLALWFKVDTASPNDMYVFQLFRTSGGVGNFTCRIDATNGKLTFAGVGDSAGTITHSSTASGLYDGNWHHLVVKVDQTASATTLKVFIDGATDSTYTATAKIDIGASNRRIVFGGSRNTAWTNNTYCLPGAMSCVTLFTYTSLPSDANCTGIYTAGFTGDSGASLSTRLTKLAAFANATTPSVADSSGFTLSGQDTAGKTYLECVQQIAESDSGVFYMDRTATPRYRSSGARSSGASVKVNIDASQDLAQSLTIEINDSQFANTVNATGPVGAYVAVDSTSVSALGPVVDQFECFASTEALLQSSAATRLTARLNNNPRVNKVVFDMLTSPNSTKRAALEEIVPLDRIRISNLTTTWVPGGTTTFDGFVEGVEYSITDQSYTCTLDLSPVI